LGDLIILPGDIPKVPGDLIILPGDIPKVSGDLNIASCYIIEP